MRILADDRVNCLTLIASRDRVCEEDLDLEHYRLSGLDPESWQEFFYSHQITNNSTSLSALHKIYGGNAKAMGIICGAIAEDFEGDIDAYWLENCDNPLGEKALKNLVASQFDRLENLDKNAYRLLCRLGAYRYQDIPRLPTEALLFLLGDVEENKRRETIESLKNRSLIEVSKGQYWLHPAIQTEAMVRLKATQEWIEVNLKIAEFWSDRVPIIITVSDALMALEAYYHYLAIGDRHRAGQTLLKSRNNQWGQFLPLASTLYCLGLLEPIYRAILPIIDCIELDSNLLELYNILGDIYWITGKIERAIFYQEKTITHASFYLEKSNPTASKPRDIYYLKMLQVDSLLSIGLYNIDLWELSAAVKYFEKVIELAANTERDRWAKKARVCLALVNSYLDLPERALVLAEPIYQSICQEEFGKNTGGWAYFIQILGQTYFNLGDWQKSLYLYELAITFSQSSHYTQVRAKAISGLAAIYREQFYLDLAIEHHQNAIALLEKVGAKCDLAQAYWEFALTWQKIGQIEASLMAFTKARDLFAEINAPKQIAKIVWID